MNTPEIYDRVVGLGVDFQNDFATGGALAVPNAEAAIAPFNRVTRWVCQQKGLMTWSRDAHRPDNKVHFAKWSVHCVDGTYGAEIHKDLEVNKNDIDIIINKGTGLEDDGYSAFEGLADGDITLETLVMPARAERVALIIGGWATDYCVKETGLDGIKVAHHVFEQEQRLGEFGRPGHLGIFVVTDCVQAVNIAPDDGEKALQEMVNAGVQLITSDQLLAGEVIAVR